MPISTKYVKFYRGTQAAYNNIATKDPEALYFIYPEVAGEAGKLYLGTNLIGGGDASNMVLGDLNDILLNQVAGKHILVYDDEEQKWKNASFSDILKTTQDAVFTGANAETGMGGTAGLVPAPTAAQANYFLRGDGTWASPAEFTSSAVYEVITNEEETHSAAITRALGNLAAENDDIAIVKDLIADNKYQFTAYIYDGEKWVAMDGNYDAENVYFKDDILVTTKIGTIQTLTNGQATLTAKGKNVKQVLSALLAERKYPTATLPSASITLTNSGSYEVGTKITPTWKTSFSTGSYTYGPATGVTDTGGSVTSTKDTTPEAIGAGSINGKTGSFEEYQVEDNTAYKAYLAYGYNASTSTPVDNFGDEYTNTSKNLPIPAATNKTATSGNSITGFRKWFKGGLTSTSVDVALTSAIIRDNLTHSESAVSAQTFELKAADYEGCKRIVIAIPKDANISITGVLLKSASNADILSEFKEKANLDILGAESYLAASYRIWIYEPAALDSTEIYTITLG